MQQRSPSSEQENRVSPLERTHGYKLKVLTDALDQLDTVDLQDNTKVKAAELARSQANALSNPSCWEILKLARPRWKGKQIDKGENGPKGNYKTTRQYLPDAIWLRELGILEDFIGSELNFHKGWSKFRQILKRSEPLALDILKLENRPRFEILELAADALKQQRLSSLENVLQHLRDTGVLKRFELNGKHYEMPVSTLERWMV